jgi:uncharacterized membrane protein YkoI
MNDKKLWVAGILALSVVGGASTWALLPAHAGQNHDDRALLGQAEIVPLEDIITEARRQRPGRVLEAELEDEQGTLAYEVKILDEEGRLWELEFDAANGKLLEEEREH